MNLSSVFNLVVDGLPSKLACGGYMQAKIKNYVSFMHGLLTINRIQNMPICLVIIIFLSSCQATRLQTIFKKPLYEADITQVEQILYFVDQEKYEAAFAENEKLERRYDDSENVSHDYSRVVITSARINAILLKRVIQDKNNRLKQSQNIEQLNSMNQEMNSVKKSLIAQIDKLAHELKGMNITLKTIESLKAENKALQQQIEDFKKIDLQSEQNINSTQ